MEFRECVFENWRFSGCSMPRLGFVDAVFRGCDLSNLDLTGCSLLRCRFEDCKAVGLTLAEAKLRQVTFEQCGMRLANLSGCQCKGAGFFRCDLEGASMLGCALGKAPFDRCRLLDCNLCGTVLSGIDFTTCDIGGWLLGGGELRGAVVTPFQAAELAGCWAWSLRRAACEGGKTMVRAGLRPAASARGADRGVCARPVRAPVSGDVLAAVLLYCLARAVGGRAPAWLPAAVFLAAAAVEAAQYFQLGARLHLDTVPVIRVILGSVFDWMDILCYAVGAGLCALWQAAEPRILSRKTG